MIRRLVHGLVVVGGGYLAFTLAGRQPRVWLVVVMVALVVFIAAAFHPSQEQREEDRHGDQ